MTDNLHNNKTTKANIVYLDDMMSCMPGNVFWVDENSQCLGGNKHFLAMLGIQSSKDIIGKTYEELALLTGWTKQQCESFKKDDVEVLKKNKIKLNGEEFPVIDSHGNENYFSTNRAPLYNEKKQIIGVIVVFIEVIQQKQKKDVLRKNREFIGKKNKENLALLDKLHKGVIGQSAEEYETVAEYAYAMQRHLKSIIACMPGHVYWMDKNCIYLGGNDNVAKMMGLKSPDEIIGITYDRMAKLSGWSEGQAQSFQNDDLEVMKTGQPKLNIEEPPVPDRNGNPIYFLTSRVPLFDENKQVNGVVGISIDITERKKIEAQLKISKEKAETANKAKTEFLDNMRHDIRTPLTGIIGFSDIIKNEVTDPKMKEYASNLSACGYSLLDLLNGILEAVKVSSGEIPILKEKFDLKKKLNEVISLNQPKAHQKDLALLFDYDSTIPDYLIGDAKRVHRIVLELVANALNFTHKGYVKLSASLAKDDKKSVILKIAVEDTGIGIDPQKQQDIYVQFKRLTPSYEGVYRGFGLGLSILKQLVDELEGEIYLKSEIDVGSKFTFIVKLKKALIDEDFGSEDVIPLEESHNFFPITKISAYFENECNNSIEKFESHILVVEDNPRAAQVVGNMLSAMSCKVDIAEKGKLGVQLAEENEYDLIFMDIGLPDIDGYEATKRIRLNELNKKHVPIIALTAHADEESKKNCIEIGMNAVLTKPLLKEKAEDILNSFIAYRRDKLKEKASDTLEKNNEKPELPLLDFELLEKQFGKAAAVNLLNDLVASFPEERVAFDLAYKESDWPSIQKLAHKLKGGVSYCGTMRLVEACSQLELAIREEKTERFEALYTQLLNEILLAGDTIKEKFEQLDE